MINRQKSCQEPDLVRSGHIKMTCFKPNLFWLITQPRPTKPSCHCLAVKDQVTYAWKTLLSSRHFTGITSLLVSFQSFSITTATWFAETLTRANSQSKIFFSSYTRFWKSEQLENITIFMIWNLYELMILPERILLCLSLTVCFHNHARPILQPILRSCMFWPIIQPDWPTDFATRNECIVKGVLKNCNAWSRFLLERYQPELKRT